MWCAAYTVADVTGWTRDQVWLHVRARKEARGERLNDRGPVGGIQDQDWQDALQRAGYQLVEEWKGRQSFADFVRGRHGVWILGQRGHIFAWRPGRYPMPTGRYSPILRAWRVEKRSTHGGLAGLG